MKTRIKFVSIYTANCNLFNSDLSPIQITRTEHLGHFLTDSKTAASYMTSVSLVLFMHVRTL